MTPEANRAKLVVMESIADADVIAKAGLRLALDRVSDLDENPMIMLVMMEALVKQAIGEYEKLNLKVGGLSTTDALVLLRTLIHGGVEEQFRQHKRREEAKREAAR